MTPLVCVRGSCRWPSLCPAEGYCWAERMEKGAQTIDRDRRRAAARALERTEVPGVYRRDGRFVVVTRGPDGKQRKTFAATMEEAVAVKARLTRA